MKFLSCFSRKCNSPPSAPPQKTLKTASNKALLILMQQPNVSRNKKMLIQRELKRRNKENYGYELAKMFGTSPPPTNKTRIAHGNVIGRIARDSRLMFAPEHTEHFLTRRTTQKPNNPEARFYRAKRTNTISLQMNRRNKNPKAFKNMGWRFRAFPLAHRNHNLFYNTINSQPFMINKKSGLRKQVPQRLLLGGVSELTPRNMRTNTWNAYTKRVNTYVKQLKSLQRANNYAMGRSNKKPSNSSMRFYFQKHPRPAQMNAQTVNNLRRALKERIQGNLFEYMPVPLNANLQRNWEILTNRNQVNNINNLITKMKRYSRKASGTWRRADELVFGTLYNRLVTRNKYGFYYR